MQRDAEALFPADNVDICGGLVSSEARLDGRSFDKLRPVTIDILPDDSGATVALGNTRMHAAVTAQLPTEPGAKSGAEGRLALDVRWSPMGCSSFSGSTRLERHAMEISMLLQRIIVEAAMVDLEALTVQRGLLAWTIYLDIHVLCHSGNLIDCAVMAAMAALTSFRLPQTEVSPTGDLTVFSVHEREPLPLTIHHIPFAVSFGLFADGDVVLTDPIREELEASHGSITVLMSEHGELCGIHKVEGCPVSPDVAMRCVRLAGECAKTLGQALQEALKVHEIARVYSRVRRVGAGQAGQALGSTAKAAETVNAARLKVIPHASGQATLPRTEVTVSQAIPASQLPNLTDLAVEGDDNKSAAAQSSQPASAPRTSGDVPKGKETSRAQATSTSMKGSIQSDLAARIASDPGASSSRGQHAVELPEKEAGEDSDAMDEDDHTHIGVGVRITAAKSPRAAADAALGKKKPRKGLGTKRASPGGTPKGGPTDTFEEIAQLISGPRGDADEAPNLKSCVRTAKKKRKQQK